MPFALEITTGEYAGKLYVLESYAPMLLGRARDADLVVPDMDTSISRYHALIEVGTDGISVRDMQGQLRTRVNGRVVNTAKMIPGDTLTLGNTSFVLHDRTELAPSTAPVEPGPEAVASTPEHRPTAPPPGWNANDDEVATLFAPLANLLPLRCSHCGIAGPLPPDPTLAGAAWLCRSCIEVGRNRRPHDPHHLGNYEILRFLAQGGMGQVYEGVSRDTGMHVAVKQLVRSGGNGDSIVQRFMREQRLARAMRHPSIVRCYDVGTTTHSMYIVTEFMTGGDALRLASPNSNVHMILSIGAALFRALEYGHSLGVVHRDVKPQNLLLGRTNEHNIPIARLTDFGLAKSVRDAGLRPITARGEGGGSLLMMGPEQLLNFQYADPSCDLFSGAALLYRLLTGSTHLSLSKGMHEANMHDVGRAILDDKRVPLAQRRSDVPDMICEILDGLLARNPSLRTHMKADQIAAFLEEWAQRTQPT